MLRRCRIAVGRACTRLIAHHPPPAKMPHRAAEQLGAGSGGAGLHDRVPAPRSDSGRGDAWDADQAVGGGTADTLAAQREMTGKGVPTIAIYNVVGSMVTR